MTDEDFAGAKLLLFFGSEILTIRRDDIPGIPWPGLLDFPGGGRESGETAAACVLRETEEEVGLRLSTADLVWRGSRVEAGRRGIYFAAHLEARRVSDVRLGSEGTEWLVMPPDAFLARTDVVPHFKRMLHLYLVEGDIGEPKK